MKRSGDRLWLTILLGLILFPISRLSVAFPASLENPSFEADVPDTSWSCDSSGISCWKAVMTGWTFGSGVVTWRPNPDDPSTSYTDGVPDGMNVAAVDPSGYIQQALPEETLTEGYTYTLNASVGRRNDVGQIQYAVELLAGDRVIAQDRSTQNPGAGEFALSTVSYTAQLGDLNAGLPLSIRLVNSGGANQVNFDLVSLDVSQTTLELSPIDDQAVVAGGGCLLFRSQRLIMTVSRLR